MQILEIPAQREFVSSLCHTHSNAHKPPKTVAPPMCHAHSNAHKPPKTVASTYMRGIARPHLPPNRPNGKWKNKYIVRGKEVGSNSVLENVILIVLRESESQIWT